MMDQLVSVGSITAALFALVPALATFLGSRRKSTKHLDEISKDLDQKLKRLAEIQRMSVSDPKLDAEVGALMKQLEEDLQAIRQDVASAAEDKNAARQAKADI
jgi:hypothetical protein